ncbi:Ubiquitin-conjugating enzyme E2-binding protein [Macleaya cordata]|uniref:Ubiquitin-conjugating enzyme E2-binding protein n=1 Tax=Macleaya cordata TaxID=56857 RepID=A0A200QE53_MACCD|nr:Ubiquitin-conjugating enzyme E2-binding protein [Macleaya cordata]
MSDHRNPRNWRCTWETLSHVPTLRLFLFSPDIKPATQCKNLKIHLKFEESLLLVSWNEEIEHQNDGSVDFLLRVPVPRVLVELGSPVDFKATEDHIEVKLVLLLPVDHPLAVNFSSVLNFSDEEDSTECSDRFQSLSIDSDIKRLLSGDGVDFYCKSCSNKLTKRPLRSFVEMPSVDWREVADNWFGSCCCSFGGISEKLVIKYSNSYSSSEGTCLYDSTCVVVSKDDLVGYTFPDCFDGSKMHDCGPDPVGEVNLPEIVVNSHSDCGRDLCSGTKSDIASNGDDKLSCMSPKRGRIVAYLEDEIQKNNDTSFCTSSISDVSGNVMPGHGFSEKDHSHCCSDKTSSVSRDYYHEVCSHGDSITSSEDQEQTNSIKLLQNRKSLLNGSLGNGFMVRTSNLSKDVEWIEFRCTQCSNILGAYPSMHDGHAPLDGGVRFFKCYISSSLPVGGSRDVFRNHSLQRMFVNQLIESANDELSFRTVVRDLRSNCPMLQIVLLNSNAWCCTGYCLETEGTEGTISKIDLHPVVKVLFSNGSNTAEAQSRMIEEWATKNQAHEVYMLTHQIKELIETLKSAQDRLPFSCSFMPGLTLSSLER